MVTQLRAKRDLLSLKFFPRGKVRAWDPENWCAQDWRTRRGWKNKSPGSLRASKDTDPTNCFADSIRKLTHEPLGNLACRFPNSPMGSTNPPPHTPTLWPQPVHIPNSGESISTDSYWACAGSWPNPVEWETAHKPETQHRPRESQLRGGVSTWRGFAGWRGGIQP